MHLLGCPPLPGARVIGPPVSPCLLAPSSLGSECICPIPTPYFSPWGPICSSFSKASPLLKASHIYRPPSCPAHSTLSALSECNSLLSLILPDPGQMLAALLACSKGTAMPPPPLHEVAQHITLQCFPYSVQEPFQGKCSALFLWASLSAEWHGTPILFSTAQENVDVDVL